MENKKDIHGLAREQLWAKLHIPLQKKLIRYAGPAIFCFLALFSVWTAKWQSTALLVSIVLLELTWITGYVFMSQKRMDASVYLMTISTILFSTIVSILIPKTMAGAALLGVAAVVYSALYSKKHTILTALAFGLSVVFIELTFLYKPVSILDIGTSGRLIVALLTGVFVIPLITLFLFESRRTNLKLFYILKEKNSVQAALIQTVNQTRPIVDTAVGDVRRVSNLFAEQASGQASAAAEISATVSEVSATAEETAEKAKETRDIALTIQSRSERSCQRLAQVEDRFKEAIELIGGARQSVVELGRDINQLDQILISNMRIGRQIRFLAINTGIQAAKAGRHLGGGFRVIASELRQMIWDTDRNLSRTQHLLSEIRDQSTDSSVKIEEGAERLERFFDELRRTANDIEISARNMASTVERISRIATAAKQQQVGMNGISTAMKQIDTAAAALSHSAAGLIESISQIMDTQRELGNALGEGTRVSQSQSESSRGERGGILLAGAENRKDFVVGLYLPIQKILSVIVGPALVAVFALLTFRTNTWQDIVLLVSAVGMSAAWFAVYRSYKKGRLAAGNSVFVVASFGFTTLAGMLIPCLIPMVMIANIGIMAYGIFFASRYAVVCAVCASGSYLFCELSLALAAVTPRPVLAGEQFIVQTALICILLPVITLFFRRSQTINEELFQNQTQKGIEQAKAIKTIRSIYPVISRAIGQIELTSRQFNEQASEQAASAAQIYTTVSEVKATAGESAKSAADTQRTTKTTEKDSVASYQRLKSIEGEFAVVNKLISNAVEEAFALGQKVDRIEEILGFNAEINQQVKILAVNAGIEAAKAGRFAGGFRIVAVKLRQMIQRTDENTRGVRSLLESIRLKTRESIAEIERGSRQLSTGFRQLQKVAADLEWSTARFVDTAEQVAKIARAAKEQQVGMEGVSVAMEQIDKAAAQLSESGVILKESIVQIESTQTSLQQVLHAKF